jgi:zinc transport system substrate-binding protein
VVGGGRISAAASAATALAIAGACAGVAAGAAACGARDAADPRPVVAVSVAPQAFVVEKIAGDLVRVSVTLPPGAEAHTYEPSLTTVRSVADASLYVKVGHPAFTFERTWLADVLGERRDLVVVDSTQGAQTDASDPHVWVAPSHVRTMARNVAAALSDLLPAHRETFARNLAALEREIDAVDRDVRAALARKRGRRFFVFHPAWSYFAAAYGLEQVAIEREGREPDPKALAEIIRDARASGVKVVFTQPQHSGAAARLVAEEIGARIEDIDPLAHDWDRNLREAAAKIGKGLVS